MAILVTGGAGFIGSHLLDRLAETTDEQLICIDDFNDTYNPRWKRANIARLAQRRRVTVAEGSICDQAFCAAVFQTHSIQRVVHLAARAGIRASVQDPLLAQQTNCHGTLVLLELARRHEVRQFVFASSSSVYGNRQKGPFSEDDVQVAPANPYGVTKRAGELFCQVYHDLHGLPVVCLRFFSVYGPRNRPDMAVRLFAEAIQHQRELPLFGDGSARRDFTYVGDIIDGVTAAMDIKGGFATMNLGHNRPVAIRDLIAELERGLGKKARIKVLPEQPGDVGLTCADLSRASRLLGYEPKVDLSEGVARFVEWYRAQ